MSTPTHTPPIQYSAPAISPSVDWETRRHLQLLYQKLGNHTQAFEEVGKLISTLKPGSSTTTIIDGGGSSGGSSGGGGTSGGGGSSSSEFLGQGLINDQTGQTSYATVPGDNGILLILNDASPVAVTLTTDAAPFYLFITNFGAGTATLTPSSGTINGGASLSLLQNQTVLAAVDPTSTIWETTAITVSPQNAPAIAHEWLNSYNAATGAFTQTQPALSDLQAAVSNSVLVGSGTAGAGNPYVEIALGSGLSMTGTTLSATGGGGGGSGVVLYFRKNLGANVSLLANTPTIVESVTINAAGGAAPAFPSVGTWRIFVSYSYYSASGSGRTGESRVVDGSGNIIAASEGGSFGDAGTNYHGAGWTPVTYSGSSGVGLVVQVVNTGAQTIDTSSVLLNTPCYVEIAVFSS